MAAHSAESGETENRLADAIEAERVATARAEKLADRVAKEELQRAKLVEDLAAAEDAVELERERAAQLAAEAEEAAAQKESANMERVAELEGRVLQIQMEAEQRVEEAEMALGAENADADMRVKAAEDALAAAREELDSHKTELAAAHETLAATDADRKRRKSLEAHHVESRRAVAEADRRCAEARLAFAEAESRCADLETQVANLTAELEDERKHKKLSMETAAKLHLQKEEAAIAAQKALEAKLAAAEASSAASKREAEQLAAEVEELRGDVNLHNMQADNVSEEVERMKEALAVADEKVAAAQTEAEDAKEKADLTETESLFFLGEMQVAVAEAEKKIVALHKTVASRDMKLAQVTGEVKALKIAVREREAKLESAESDYKAKLEAELATLKKAHAEDLESAKGEVEGQSVMLEMENEQLLKNIDDKRAKIKALQGELGRAAEKHKQLREQSEMAKAARAVAEEGRAEAEHARDELAERLKSLSDSNRRESSAAMHRLQAEDLRDELAAARRRAESLGHAVWEHGLRPRDLDGDAAAFLEELVGESAVAAATVAATPKSKILEMTQAAGKISFSKIQASVEAKKADIRRRSSLGLDNASTELASLRATIATMMEGSAKKAASAAAGAAGEKTTDAPADETPVTRGRPSRLASAMARMTFEESPSPAPRGTRSTAAAGKAALAEDSENAPPSVKGRDSIDGAAVSKNSRRSSIMMATRRKALRSLQSHSLVAL